MIPPNPRILVAGDVMRDRYYFCEASRIAGEAPCIIHAVQQVEFAVGGAANVAVMAAALGADVMIAGVVGQDDEGTKLANDLTLAGVDTRIIAERARVTTLKMRVLAESDCGWVQTSRIDCESRWEIADENAIELIDSLGGPDGIADDFDVILVSDYGKGFLTRRIRRALKKSRVTMIVDPVGRGPWPKWTNGAACLMPNRRNAGLDVRGLVAAHNLQAGIVTCDSNGVRIFANGVLRTFPATCRRVVDPTGASDQFLATLGVMIASGLRWTAAARIANNAAGLQVEQFGCAPIEPEAFNLGDELEAA